jgi:hypothetical protein
MLARTSRHQAMPWPQYITKDFVDAAGATALDASFCCCHGVAGVDVSTGFKLKPLGESCFLVRDNIRDRIVLK